MNNIETNLAPNIFLSSLHIYIRLGFNARLIWSERLTKNKSLQNFYPLLMRVR